jgi:hypothetical protein
LQVNLINANIDRLSKQHLKQHPRVKARGGKVFTKEPDPLKTWTFDGDLLSDANSGEDEDETDEDDDDDDNDEGGPVGFGFGWGPNGMMVGGNTAGGGFGQMVHPVMQMMLYGAANPFGSEDENEDESSGEWETDSEGDDKEADSKDKKDEEEPGGEAGKQGKEAGGKEGESGGGAVAPPRRKLRARRS